MLIALDDNQNRIFIDDAVLKREYYCPSCGSPLLQRKGRVRKHHFSHQPNYICTDSWEREYDMSAWHYEWQNRFPENNQEVLLAWGDTKHRADVLIGRTVIEFQHSSMSSTQFNNRNNFYQSLGYKVIWVFDMIEPFINERITCFDEEECKYCQWVRPRKTLDNFDVINGQVELFFQIRDDEEDCLIKVTEVSSLGFEEFKTSKGFSKEQFMQYVGFINGTCAEPDREDASENEIYSSFREKYGIKLNNQQERAVQAVEGANLLLAVPGSGKTTVLVVRLGYMIICKGIAPNKILAMTYTTAAADDMRKRFTSLFGSELGNEIQFKTINSVCNRIIQRYAKQPFRQLSNNEKARIVKSIYIEINKEYPTESDIIETEVAIGYIKNMMLNDDEIEMLEVSVPNHSQIYKKYRETLRQKRVMDFDDQMLYAYQILQRYPGILDEFQNQYEYICVDEAQDTSKIQHKIIQMLAGTNNIFMVGDEDQSIYGFRGAYPKALLNFKNEYRNPFILMMEHNYRSTDEIVNIAQRFIANNLNRNKKTMIANRGHGELVQRVSFTSRSEQYKYLLEVSNKQQTKTAILYRDNDIAIPLMDLLFRNRIPFRALQVKTIFFTNKIVEDIKAFIKLAINPFDTDSFMKIYYKCGYGFNKKTAEWTCKKSQWKHMSVPDALKKQLEYWPSLFEKAEDFECFLGTLKELESADAIDFICSNGYGRYLKKNSMDVAKIELLRILAEQEPEKESFLKRLDQLPKMIESNSSKIEECIILSTVHSSKGLEYDSVYIMDTNDGIFPSVDINSIYESTEIMDKYQEERRLFYVAMTRAINKLYILTVANKKTTFADEILPIERKVLSSEKVVKYNNSAESGDLKAYEIEEHKWPEIELSWEIAIMKQREERIRIEQEAEKQKKRKREIEKMEYLKRGYNEVKDQFTQQEEWIVDSSGQRWIKCEECDCIKPVDYFNCYGGINHVNLGVCTECARKNRPI